MPSYSIKSDDININVFSSSYDELHIGTLYAGLKNISTNSIANNLKNVTLPTVDNNNDWCTIKIVKADDTAAYIYANINENETGVNRTCSFKLKYGTLLSNNLCKITQNAYKYIKGIGLRYYNLYPGMVKSITSTYGFNSRLKCGIIQFERNNTPDAYRIDIKKIYELSSFSKFTYYKDVNKIIGYIDFSGNELFKKFPNMYGVIYDSFEITDNTFISSGTKETLSKWIDLYVTSYNSVNSSFNLCKRIISPGEYTDTKYISVLVGDAYYTRIGTVAWYVIGYNGTDINYIPASVFAKFNHSGKYTLAILSYYDIIYYGLESEIGSESDPTEYCTLDLWQNEIDFHDTDIGTSDFWCG